MVWMGDTKIALSNVQYTSVTVITRQNYHAAHPVTLCNSITLNDNMCLSQDNVVCLSPRLAQSLGNMGQVCVCIHVTSTVHLIDPNTLQREYCWHSWPYTATGWIAGLVDLNKLGTQME